MHPLLHCASRCPACDADVGYPLVNRDGKTGRPLNVVVCAVCGLGRLDPLPTEEILSHWYKNEYRQQYKQSERPSRRHVLRAARLATERFEWLRRRIPTVAIRNALDIGASSGEFVYLLKKLGIQATGVEPHAGYANQARDELELDVLPGTLDDNRERLGSEQFDLITMFHVLEHMLRPVETLTALGTLLAAGGLIYLEVPNAGRESAPNNMFFRAHTLYFTCHSMAAIAHAAGFEIVADNFDDPGNVCVVLRRSDAQEPPRWSYDEQLLTTQARRRWVPYLWRALTTGRVRQRLISRAEEKKTAAQFMSDRQLLDSVHGAYVHTLKAARAST